jgi:hypothetical protein
VVVFSLKRPFGEPGSGAAHRQHAFEHTIVFDDAVQQSPRYMKRHQKIDQILPDEVGGDRRL